MFQLASGINTTTGHSKYKNPAVMPGKQEGV